ncbi:MAG: hypothetical protein ACTSX6_11110 [Candidatus Heimdallarchaeaceae archaeon]
MLENGNWGDESDGWGSSTHHSCLYDPNHQESDHVLIQDVFDNIDSYSAASMEKFSKPARIGQKVDLFCGHYSKWHYSKGYEKIMKEVLARTPQHRTKVLSGIKNIDMSSTYPSGCLGHEVENFVYLLSESPLRRDSEVIRESWEKMKQTPNGYLRGDEAAFFVDYALDDDSVLERFLGFSPVREGLRKGLSVYSGILPIITDETHCEQFLRSGAFSWLEGKDINSLRTGKVDSKLVLEILDRAIFR